MEYLTDNWQLLVQAATVLLVAIGGAPGFKRLVDWLKAATGAEGNAARLILVVVSTVAALVILIASGQLLGEDLRPDTIVVTIGLIYQAASGYYHWLQRQKVEPIEILPVAE
jgi:hypothetical protein